MVKLRSPKPMLGVRFLHPLREAILDTLDPKDLSRMSEENSTELNDWMCDTYDLLSLGSIHTKHPLKLTGQDLCVRVLI